MSIQAGRRRSRRLVPAGVSGEAPPDGRERAAERRATSEAHAAGITPVPEGLARSVRMELRELSDSDAFGARQLRLQARIMGSMWLTGGLIGALAIVLPTPVGVNRLAAAVLTTIAVVLGTAVMLEGRRLPNLAYHLLLAGGTVTTSAGVYLARGDAMSAGVAAMYVWVGIYSAYFFSRRATAAHLALVGTCFLVVASLAWGSSRIALVLIVISTVLLGTLVVARLKAELRSIALTDTLTGLPNRQALERILAREVARISRFGGSLCVGVIDLDGFKDVNDTRGHLAGDMVLRQIAASWYAALRRIDILARYGGDEFVVVLPSCSKRNAIEIFGRLKSQSTIGWSVGVAEWMEAEPYLSLLHRADQALLEAKESGRSCIICG